MRIIFALHSVNMSNLGGPMGSDDSTPTNWIKYFHNKLNAKKFAQHDYDKLMDEGKGITKKIEWLHEKLDSTLVSEDLGFVQYHIEIIKYEDESGG